MAEQIFETFTFETFDLPNFALPITFNIKSN